MRGFTGGGRTAAAARPRTTGGGSEGPPEVAMRWGEVCCLTHNRTADERVWREPNQQSHLHLHPCKHFCGKCMAAWTEAEQADAGDGGKRRKRTRKARPHFPRASSVERPCHAPRLRLERTSSTGPTANDTLHMAVQKHIISHKSTFARCLPGLSPHLRSRPGRPTKNRVANRTSKRGVVTDKKYRAG